MKFKLQLLSNFLPIKRWTEKAENHKTPCTSSDDSTDLISFLGDEIRLDELRLDMGYSRRQTLYTPGTGRLILDSKAIHAKDCEQYLNLDAGVCNKSYELLSTKKVAVMQQVDVIDAEYKILIDKK